MCTINSVRLMDFWRILCALLYSFYDEIFMFRTAWLNMQLHYVFFFKKTFQAPAMNLVQKTFFGKEIKTFFLHSSVEQKVYIEFVLRAIINPETIFFVKQALNEKNNKKNWNHTKL